MARTRSAARFPDRTEPSMVAGNPVSVQSPARNRFLKAVLAPGRSAFCSGVASNVARRSRTICQGGSSRRDPGSLADIPPERLGELLARHIDQPVSAADGDRQALGEREKPFHQPSHDAQNGWQVLRRLETKMTRSRWRGISTAFSAPAAMRPQAAAARPARRRPTAPPRRFLRRTSARSRDPLRCQIRAAHGRSRISAPLPCNSLIAGSTRTALKPSRAINGRQACPPASSVSRTTAPARPADPSGGSTLSAANNSGCTNRWYSRPSQGMASPTSLAGEDQIKGINAR